MKGRTSGQTIPLPQGEQGAAERLPSHPAKGRSFVEFLHSLPRWTGEDYRRLVAAVAATATASPMTWNAHVIRQPVSMT